MKKIIALLLVAVMCFSLAACGGDNETSNNNEPQTNNSETQQENESSLQEETEQETNKNDDVKTIEITTENWQEYLVLEHLEMWQDYGCDVMETLCLKDEYADKVISDETSVEIEWTGTAIMKECQFDMDNQTIQIGETCSDYEIDCSEIAKFEAALLTHKPYSEYNAIAFLYCGASDHSTYTTVIEDFNVVSAKGTIVFE